MAWIIIYLCNIIPAKQSIAELPCVDDKNSQNPGCLSMGTSPKYIIVKLKIIGHIQFTIIHAMKASKKI